MSYATPAQLAEALETRATDANTALLQACLDAATAEIDHALEGTTLVDPPPDLVVRVNVNRAVEWFKAPAAYNGGVGSTDTAGVLTAPSSGFERHAAALLPLRSTWGVA